MSYKDDYEDHKDADISEDALDGILGESEDEDEDKEVETPEEEEKEWE